MRLAGGARMLLSLKPRRIKRYNDVARLLLKYGRSDLLNGADLSDLLPQEPANEAAAFPAARELAADIQKLGPTFVKLGQLLSTRPDILPQAYIEALRPLQNDCEPFPFAEAEKILKEELGI